MASAPMFFWSFFTSIPHDTVSKPRAALPCTVTVINPLKGLLEQEIKLATSVLR